MKLERLSLRQIATGVPVLGLIEWAWAQFVFVPRLTTAQREDFYSGGYYAYAWMFGIAFLCFAMWFVFFYQGTLATHKRKIIIFAMGMGSLCGMLTNLAIRLTWHI